MKRQKACDQHLYLQDLEGEVCDWDYNEAYGGPCLMAQFAFWRLLITRNYNSTGIPIALDWEFQKQINIMCLLNYNLCGKSIRGLLRKYLTIQLNCGKSCQRLSSFIYLNIIIKWTTSLYQYIIMTSLGFPFTIKRQENHLLSLVNTRLDSYFLQNDLVMMTMIKTKIQVQKHWCWGLASTESSLIRVGAWEF